MLAEFCSPRFRGTAAGLVNVAAGGFGNFPCPRLRPADLHAVSGRKRMRWLFAALALPALLVTFYRRLVPETPRFLVAQNGLPSQSGPVAPRLRFARPHRRARPDFPDRRGHRRAAAEKRLAGPVPHAVSRPDGGRRDRHPDELRRPTLRADADAEHLRVHGLHLFRQPALRHDHPERQCPRRHRGIVLRLLLSPQEGPDLRVRAGVRCRAVHHLSRVNIYLVLLFGAVFQFFVLLLNTSIWIYAPELYPTRIRAFGVAFILATGSAAGSFIPTISGALFDHYGWWAFSRWPPACMRCSRSASSSGRRPTANPWKT